MNHELPTLVVLETAVLMAGDSTSWPAESEFPPAAMSQNGEKQLTQSKTGHILTNCGVWSPDSEWIVYDTRSDSVGGKFDGLTIEIVNVASGAVKILYQAKNGAHCLSRHRR